MTQVVLVRRSTTETVTRSRTCHFTVAPQVEWFGFSSRDVSGYARRVEKEVQGNQLQTTRRSSLYRAMSGVRTIQGMTMTSASKVLLAVAQHPSIPSQIDASVGGR
jgi:hypothetical protein